MRVNEDLIKKSAILDAIIRRIEVQYPNDVALLVCYGSFVSGGHTASSDIDFFFVPKRAKFSDLAGTFIIAGIGYDLWPVSWQRLQRMAALEETMVSIFMDGIIVYAASDKDVQKADKLKKKLLANLKKNPFTKQSARQHLDKAKALCFDLQERTGPMDVTAVTIMEYLLFSLAVMNNTYTKKGVKGIAAELNRFSVQPPRFLDTYQDMTKAQDPKILLTMLKEQITAVGKIWQHKYAAKTADPSHLEGFYEEFKSTYNKLHQACKDQDYGSAYYAAYMMDRETSETLAPFVTPGTFPVMTAIVKRDGFVAARAAGKAHEKQVLDLLQKYPTDVDEYATQAEFVQAFRPTAITYTAAKREPAIPLLDFPRKPPAKHLIAAGTKLPVRLTAAERRLIREETFYDPDFCCDLPDTGTQVVEMDLDTIEDLQGYVAAEANHTESRKIQKALDKLCDKLQVFLDTYDEP